jgi:hypothetical protein
MSARSAKPSTNLEAAFLRSLVVEVERFAPSDPRAVFLRAQLREQEARLASLADDGDADG